MVCFFFQAEDGIRYLVRSRGLGDVYKRQRMASSFASATIMTETSFWRRWASTPADCPRRARPDGHASAAANRLTLSVISGSKLKLPGRRMPLQALQWSSACKGLPQRACSIRSGGPAGPARQRSPHPRMSQLLTSSSSPFNVSRYYCRGGRSL